MRRGVFRRATLWLVSPSVLAAGDVRGSGGRWAMCSFSKSGERFRHLAASSSFWRHLAASGGIGLVGPSILKTRCSNRNLGTRAGGPVGPGSERPWRPERPPLRWRSPTGGPRSPFRPRALLADRTVASPDRARGSALPHSSIPHSIPHSQCPNFGRSGGHWVAASTAPTVDGLDGFLDSVDRHRDALR